jgi:hypothetical protein
MSGKMCLFAHQRGTRHALTLRCDGTVDSLKMVFLTNQNTGGHCCSNGDDMIPITNACFPNEDFGRSNKPFRMRFPGSTFQGRDSTAFGLQIVEKCFPGNAF